MDRETLEICRHHWGLEPHASRFRDELKHLTLMERALYEDLEGDHIAPFLRMEQERIPFAWVERCVKNLDSNSQFKSI